MLVGRQVVRIVVMRATIHLVTAEDCLTLRPLMQPILVKELAHHRDYAPALVDVDLEPVLAFAAGVLAESPRTGPQLRKVLGERFPDLDAGALAYACRCLLPLVQVPPRGVWGQTSSGHRDHGRGVAGPPAGHRPVDRRRDAALPRARSGRRRWPTRRRGRA